MQVSMGAGTRTARSGLTGRMIRRCLYVQWDPEGQNQERGWGPSVIQYVGHTRGKVKRKAATRKAKNCREPYGLCVLVFLHPAGRTHSGNLTGLEIKSKMVRN